ncbi:unnamed protein product [Ambrosiozyma monospora]|uniref:Unnamed protein product n=1 Tax=Ambrosiozyma monospora TaxID=43982 RepID=A0A9W7DGS9_AMBMO|nr:unnamed protein product [Ambrosiozyma monospora]
MPKILGIGTDIHKLTRFHAILTRNGPLASFKTTRFSQRVLNKSHELPKFLKFQEANDLESCAKLLSNSWCVKEAIYKCLDYSDQREFTMSDWFKINDPTGRPVIGNTIYFQSHPNEEILCSLSHDGDYIISSVLRQGL